jgi:hypothetical protein
MRVVVRPVLLALLVAFVSAAPARPGLVASIDAVRAAGCEGRPGLAASLHERRELDEAAKRLANGVPLEKALAAVGYQAVVAAAVHVTGDADDTAVARSVARRACTQLLDWSVTHVGTMRTEAEAWVILAAPFPSAALDEFAYGTGDRIVHPARPPADNRHGGFVFRSNRTGQLTEGGGKSGDCHGSCGADPWQFHTKGTPWRAARAIRRSSMTSKSLSKYYTKYGSLTGEMPVDHAARGSVPGDEAPL